MSVTESRLHRRLEQLVRAANDFLPADVYLGYALVHLDDVAGIPLPEAEIVAAECSIKQNMRQELARRAEKGLAGADADLAALPADAATLTDVEIVFDLFHTSSGVSVVRAVSLAQLVELMRRDDLTAEQKRRAIKTRLEALYAELQTRLGQEG